MFPFLRLISEISVTSTIARFSSEGKPKLDSIVSDVLDVKNGLSLLDLLHH